MPPKRYVGKNGYVTADVQVDPTYAERFFFTVSGNMSQAGIAHFLADEIDPFIRMRVAERFSSEGDDASGPWLPLAGTTEAIRSAKGFPPNHPINVRTHQMRDWLVNDPSDIKVSGTDVVLTYPGPFKDGLMEQKVRTAQLGKSYPQTPPRPVVALSDTDELFIQSTIVQFLLSGM